MSTYGHHIKALSKRADYLAHRVAQLRAKGVNPTFDVSELNALNWAIKLLEEERRRLVLYADRRVVCHLQP